MTKIKELRKEAREIEEKSKKLYRQFTDEVDGTDLRRFSGTDKQLLTANEKLSIVGKEVSEKYNHKREKLDERKKELRKQIEKLVRENPEQVRSELHSLDKIDRAIKDILENTEYAENAATYLLTEGGE